MGDSARQPDTTTKKDIVSGDVSGLVEAAEKAAGSHALARGFVLGVVVTGAMALFIVQNTAAVGFEWLWIDFDADLWLVLLVTFAAGLLAGPLLLAGWRRSAREQERRKRLVAKFKRPPTVPPSVPKPRT